MVAVTSRTLFSNPETWIASLLLLLGERHHACMTPTAPVTRLKGDNKILTCMALDYRRRQQKHQIDSNNVFYIYKFQEEKR